MQLSDSTHLIDCISAKQLLQALSTLHQLNDPTNNELELSFSQSSQPYFNNTNSQNNINFQIYMAIRNNKKKTLQQQKKKYGSKNVKTECKQTKNIIKSNIKKRKQNTICNDDKNNQNDKSIEQSVLSVKKRKSVDISHTKSRSHSPLIGRRPEEGRGSHPSIGFGSVFKGKNPRQKQNLPQIQQQCMSSVKLSYNSKKILMERQKKGLHYIPIQNRASQLLKEKQQRIAKQQQINMTQRQIEDGQYTFKPTINIYKKPKNATHHPPKPLHNSPHPANNSIFSQHDTLQINEVYHQSQQQIFQKHLTFAKQKIDKLNNQNQNPIPKISIDKIYQSKKKQIHQNSKFNILLDLIY